MKSCGQTYVFSTEKFIDIVCCNTVVKFFKMSLNTAG